MPGNSFKKNIISTCWEEDNVPFHYAVQLFSASAKESFDPFSGKSKILGQFSSIRKIDSDMYEAIRDPLGIGKLFYTETPAGELFFAEQFTELFQHKSRIFSVPAGKHVRIGPSGLRQTVKSILPDETPDEKLNIDSFQKAADNLEVKTFQQKLEQRLEHAFSLVRTLEDSGFMVFVALSGGLDSSIIANAAVKYLDSPIACTLDLGKSEDAEKSSHIAQTLGIRHLLFRTSRDEILDAVETAPLLCQDFRDFNVHCAALNLLLAKNIRTWADTNYPERNSSILILTGDLMNEYTCDYTEETVGDTVYYRLPRVGRKDLQRYLIRGLDTSDRELLPFRQYGLNCIQPYAVLFDLYASLDETVFHAADPKKLVNSFLVPREVMQFIPESKLRAQVGSKENMGILGLCHELGLNDRYFKSKFQVRSEEDPDRIPIFVGKYDVEQFS